MSTISRCYILKYMESIFVFGTGPFDEKTSMANLHGSRSNRRSWMLTINSRNSQRTMSWNWHWWYDSRLQQIPWPRMAQQWWTHNGATSYYMEIKPGYKRSTMKLVRFWGWQSSAETLRQVRNLGIQERMNEWMTAYIHVVGEGKLTIMSYVLIPHDFTFVNASRGEVSGVLFLNAFTCTYSQCKAVCLKFFSLDHRGNVSLVVTASADCTAKVWNWLDGECVQTLSGHFPVSRHSGNALHSNAALEVDHCSC